MRNDLGALFELGADYAETLPVFEKYFEFNRYVNTIRGWNEFYSLKDYPPVSKISVRKKRIRSFLITNKKDVTESIQAFFGS